MAYLLWQTTTSYAYSIIYNPDKYGRGNRKNYRNFYVKVLLSIILPGLRTFRVPGILRRAAGSITGSAGKNWRR